MYDDGFQPPWNSIEFYKSAKSIEKNILKINNENLVDAVKERSISSDAETLYNFRNKINEYEKILEDKEVPGHSWEYYKKIINPYEFVYTQKKHNNFPDSLCILKPLSRSYFKMIEILDIINFEVLFKNKNIKTAHVCEGPGGFIEAIYEKAFKYNSTITNSYAMTLRSKQANVPGWKRATAFLKKNRNINILYGEDNTGNILVKENQDFFINNCKGCVNIFTADGGFDFSIDYNKQEELILPLLLSSVRIAFETLCKGGVFIIKLFDIYTNESEFLLNILASHFKKWTIYKPATSRPCNPEQYFIGVDFKGIEIHIKEFLSECVKNPKDINNFKHITHNYKISECNNKYCDFENIIKKIRSNSFKTQVKCFETIFNLIDKDDEKIINNYITKNKKSSLEWCQRFKVPIFLKNF
jgi:23S rRNA U2552 (ribose-2'-O)-methylase RlmE/FtsJ